MLPNSEVFSCGPGSGVWLKRRFFLYSAKPMGLVSVFRFEVSSLRMRSEPGAVATGSPQSKKIEWWGICVLLPLCTERCTSPTVREGSRCDIFSSLPEGRTNAPATVTDNYPTARNRDCQVSYPVATAPGTDSIANVFRAAARSRRSIHRRSHSMRECFHHAYARPARR